MREDRHHFAPTREFKDDSGLCRRSHLRARGQFKMRFLLFIFPRSAHSRNRAPFYWIQPERTSVSSSVGTREIRIRKQVASTSACEIFSILLQILSVKRRRW